jgi:dTDP-4-dehydrorhamnose reductase
MKILVLGKSGFVAQEFIDAYKEECIITNIRINSKEDILKLLGEHKPDAVLNAIGRRGRPNVDWCETNQMETIIGNTLIPILVAEACQEKNVYLLHIGSGCIFYGDSSHEDKKWRENDFGNPIPVYSRTKWATDLVLSTLPNVGIARIRIPAVSHSHKDNIIDKLANYPKIIDVENSITIVDDMVRVFYELMVKKATGIFHITNPGTIKHREIIDLYHKYVNPNHTNEWIDNDELVKLGLATKGRSNNFLASDRLKEYGIEMREVHEAMEETMKKYAESLKV